MTKKPKFNYSTLARKCAQTLEAGGSIPAILAVLVLVKIEKWFGAVDPRKLESDHFLMLLYLGAEVLKTEGHNQGGV